MATDGYYRFRYFSSYSWLSCQQEDEFTQSRQRDEINVGLKIQQEVFSFSISSLLSSCRVNPQKTSARAKSICICHPSISFKYSFQISMQRHIQIVVSEQEAIQWRPNRPLGLVIISCPFCKGVFPLKNKATYTGMRVSPSPLSSQLPHSPG